MQERVEGSGANVVSMMRQLFHHGQSKDRLVRRVHQHVNPYQPEKQFPLLFQHNPNILLPDQYQLSIIELRYKLSETNIRAKDGS